MDPEFQRVLVRVFIVGGVIGILGAAALVVGFRAFGGSKPGDSFRAVVWIAIAIAVVMIGCAVLLYMSLARGA